MGISRKKLTLLIAVLMLVSFTVGAYAADGIKEVKAFLREDYKIILDGRNIKLENAALIYQDSSYLPVRELAMIFGVGIGWDDKSKTVTLTTPAAVEEPAPTPAPGGSTGGSQSQDEFIFTHVLIYKITLEGKTYSVLANDVKGMIYFRKSDIDQMKLDVSGLTTAKEKYTSEPYYRASELSARLLNPEQIAPTTEAIIHETHVEKLKSLRSFSTRSPYEKVYYIKAVSGVNQYEALLQSADGRFVMYSVRLGENDNGTYYVSSYANKFLYD